ncbi:PP2C family protein-serine/threonine phosphatase [Cohnella rhizosphaerae]|uniref:Serine/threonine-protein phosphatase n=1 Tax=Cohnella rhizosphaerae TaxID=1457232 RepID=A0A9X4KQH5_9BACL|nr:PP2C family protein-serine/threonine phosphatase [Cohnella rhizosphaerae]MDG0809346.1 serine/threonine-protein phosphatase [Cohnella rhizosphaerae]
MTRLNRSLAGALQGQTYVTAGLAMIDARAGVIDYASAGHMPPYLLNEDRLEEVEVSSLPLGVSAAVVYRERRVSFPAGARFVMYTDGMVECAGADGEMLGFDRFEKLLMTMDVRLEPGEQMKALMERVDAAAVSSEEADDRTIVLIERSRRAAGDL